VGVAAFLLGRVRDAPPRAPPVPVPALAPEEGPARSARQVPEERARPEAPASQAEAVRPAPQPRDAGEVQRRAVVIREAALRAADQAEATAARQVAEEERREQAFLEDKARGGTMALLRSLSKESVHLTEMVRDPAAFGKLFERKVHGPVVAGTAWPEREAIPDGTTLDFPSGAHVWQANALGRAERFPRDLVVQGRGMDETLVRPNRVHARDDVHSLTFRDLTIHCSNAPLVDFRGTNPATIRLERCRVIGFDSGAGGSVMFEGSSAAFYATDCRIEARYGRGGDGNLFRVRSGFLARLENCVLVGPFRSVYDQDGNATYHFVRCHFVDMPPQMKGQIERPRSGVRFLDCRVDYAEPGVRFNDERSLGDLNPAWK
jgi:hypothetical protein